jgi:ABC-type nitrate/sulfonate/bicarbonate transport system, ATPase component
MSGITYKDFTFGYSNELLFKGFNATFEEGKINVILGSSGVGKTTLVSALTGQLKHGGTVTGVPEKLSYVFQNDRLVPSLSLYKNLELVLLREISDKVERKKRIEDMLEKLEISELKNRKPKNVSGGQAQRVSIARAFLYDGSLLIMDEPFQGLDISLKTRLIKLFLKIWQEDKRTVIMVTHDVYEALLLADVAYVLAGSPAEIAYSAFIPYDKETRTLQSPEITAVRDALISKIM